MMRSDLWVRFPFFNFFSLTCSDRPRMSGTTVKRTRPEVGMTGRAGTAQIVAALVYLGTYISLIFFLWLGASFCQFHLPRYTALSI
jgi:hypothetical protein